MKKEAAKLIKEKLGWAPSQPLRKGLEATYQWVEQRVLSNSMPKLKPNDALQAMAS